MHADLVIELEGGRLVFVHYGDAQIALLATILGSDFAEGYLATLNLPEDGNVHVIIYDDGAAVVAHDEFLARLADDSTEWVNPVNAGQDAQDLVNEIAGNPTDLQREVQALAVQAHDCECCLKPGYMCPIRQAAFSRSAYDARVAETKVNPPQQDPVGSLVVALLELDGLLAEMEEVLSDDEPEYPLTPPPGDPRLN